MAVTRDKINRDKVLQEAQKLVEKKRFDKAIVELQKLVAEDPTDVRTLLKIGDLYLKLQQFSDAIGTYERVGQHYSAQGFAVKAVAVYKQIREIIQKHVPHLEDRFGHIVPRLAELLTQLGLQSDALAYYEEMATRFQRVGRERDAIDVFKKIIGLDSQNPLSHLRLADALVRVRDLDGAVEEYAAAGQILLAMGRQDDALRVVERILQHRQDAKYARLAAEIYLSRGQAADGMAALTKLQLCFKEDPRDLDTLALLARVFDQLGQPQKAVEVQKEAARIAKEANRTDIFDALLVTLQKRAPMDEGVRALSAIAKQPSSLPAPPSAMPPSAMPPSAMPPSAMPPSEVELDADDLVSVASSHVSGGHFSAVKPRSMAPLASPSSRGDDEEPFALRGPQVRSAAAPHGDPAPSTTAPLTTGAPTLKQIIGHIEQLRQRGDYHEAVRQLQTAVSAQPAARELREKLCDILIESGDQDHAIIEMLGFASYLAQSDDQEGAARLLDEVLLLDASNEAALQMLQALGYSVPEEEAGGAAVSFEGGDAYPSGREAAAFTEPEDAPPAYASAPPAYASAPPPLPPAAAYSPGAHDPYAAHRPGSGYPEQQPYQAAQPAYPPQPHYGAPQHSPANPYAQGHFQPEAYPQPQFSEASQPQYGQQEYTRPYQPLETTGPFPQARPATGQPPQNLPAYDLDADETGSHTGDPFAEPPTGVATVPPDAYSNQGYDYGHAGSSPPAESGRHPAYGRAPLPSFPMADEATNHGTFLNPQAIHGAERRSDNGQLDEAALEEIEFFQAHGMFEEATGLLNAELGRLPNHPLLLDRKRELEELIANAAGASVEQQPESSQVDRSFDIASALSGLDALDALEEAPPAARISGSLGAQVSVEAVFEQFKAGVAAQVSESDAATHYDLGMAYKDMGLFADAINEFELAARDPVRECIARSMIGMMNLERGEIDQAIDAFIRGLHAPQKLPDQEIALTYEIGNAYEQRENREQALYYFQLVARLNPNYRDMRGSVSERIASLSDEAPPRAKAAVGADDEFDAAFDGLLDEK